MSTGYFEVDTDLLNRDTEELMASIEKLRSRLSEMESGMSALSATWDGTAKTAFLSQFEKDSTFFSVFLDEIVSFAEDLQAAVKEYNACEKEVLDTVQAIQI